jgi:hypothetical protein
VQSDALDICIATRFAATYQYIFGGFMLGSALRTLFNRGGIFAVHGHLGNVLDRSVGVRVVTWDYDIHGGDSDVEIPLGQSLPANAIIKIPYFMGENLGVGGGGVTVALGCGSQQLTTDQGSVVSNFDSGSSVWDAVLDNGGSGDTKMLVADGGELKLLIKGNPLVSGKITWFIEFVVKQDTIDVQ